MVDERNESEERQTSPLFDPEQKKMAPILSATLLASHSILQKRKMDEMDDPGIANEDSDEDDDNDEDEDEDGEEFVGPHDIHSEPLPTMPIYHPAVKDVELFSYQLVEPFRDYLQNSTFKDPETEFLLQLTQELERPPHESEKIRIGLVGDAGHGKSSLLNSILGLENLAVQGDDGNSCTFVVLEFAQAPSNQTTPYRAVIEFFTRQSCTEFIKEQLANFYLSISKTEETDEEESHELRLAATTAVTILNALFMDRPEFSDKEHGEEFLAKMSSADDPVILNKLISWVDFILDELMPNIGNNADSATFTANTAAALSEMITPFTMTVPYPSFEGTKVKCCPWPLVKKVRITFDSRILGQGIIIGDLPGTSDKIRSRVDSTKRYLQTCDISIVVNRLERAIDHEAFVNQINEAFKRRRSGSIIVVCTRSDDLQINSKQSFAYTPTEEAALLEISNEEFRITKKIQDLKEAISSLKAKKHATEKFKLMHKKETMLLKKRENSLKRFEVRVQARNRHVKSSIAEGYRLETKDRAPLPIFTVSNTVHSHYLKGYLRGNPPELSLHGTEIPQLREAIYSIPSTGRFSSLEHHCRFRLPEFLNTVEISCTVSRLKRKELLMKTFNRSREALRQTVESRAEDFRGMEFEAVHAIIINNELKWTRKARGRCDKWKNILPPASHRSVVRHQGEWKTKKIDAQHWNNDLLIPVALDLDPVFERIHDEVCDQFTQDISERVGEAVTKLSTALDGEPAASLSGALKAFQDNLQQRRKDIHRACESFRKEIKREVRKLHVRATTDSPDHYFTEAMKPVYTAADRARKSRGGTIHSARCATFASLVCAVGEESIFLQISQGIRNDFDKMFAELIEDFIGILDSIFARTQHDVDAVCSAKEDDSPEAKRVKEDLLAMLPEARALLTDEIWTHLDLCRGK